MNNVTIVDPTPRVPFQEVRRGEIVKVAEGFHQDLVVMSTDLINDGRNAVSLRTGALLKLDPMTAVRRVTSAVVLQPKEPE